MKVFGVRERSEIVSTILRERLDTLLPSLMRETGFDMWIVVSNEDNHDPVYKTLIPWETWAPILQIVVFFDRGEAQGVERLNVSITDLGELMTPAWSLADPDDQWAVLRRIVDERAPRRIGIDSSDVIWAADGLSAALRDKLVATLGAGQIGRAHV